MTWTYSGDPKASDLDQARFLCGDTMAVDPLVTDEELNWLITQRGSAVRAAQDACLAIMAKMAREVDYYLGPERVRADQRYKHYQDMVKELRAMWIGLNAAPSWSDPTVAMGTKYPIFDVGMTDDDDGGGGEWMRRLRGD